MGWLGAWLLQLGLVLSFAAVNLALASVTFLACHNTFVHNSFFSQFERSSFI